MEVTPTLIGGQFVGARSGETIDSFNPATGELLGRIPRLGKEDVDLAVEESAKAAVPWGRTKVQERVAMVHRLADRLEERGEELAILDAKDNGTPIWVMRRIVAMASNYMRYQANLATEVHGETVPDEFDHLNISIHQPYGVTARIVPFNHPLMNATTKIVPALVTGNTVLLKPSEHTSLSALELAKDFNEIFPSGVVSVITGYANEAGNAIIDHPEVRRIAFIGGAAGGRAIQERAARAGVKNVTLELGGKNPLVVFPDADLDAAAEAAVIGMNFGWQGESCASTSRLMVHEEVHDEFVARVAAKIDALRPGNPLDDTVDTGAIASRPQFEKVLQYIELGKQEGRLVAGGGRATVESMEDGLFVRPTMFDGIDPRARIAQEEIFGPVLVAIRFKDYDDAVKIANGIEYGLTASVFTQDYTTAHRFARDVEAGYVWVNTVSRLLPGTPYGGIKNSGVGREGHLDELRSFTNTKNITFKF
ncbi:aldehyde dehydrogenase family protein [Arthrobacter sulfonylureivorans]|uniref:Aldehyde dehydrogenase family protein n=1 Tax=Arthrobacter sulfonylureivorans TaxID=2486855 RepID=A0ABY3WCN7_9MICC|nr:aldehyde dehydrogenase family protein [Arthrobacter sulfonylureivorans]UNK46067.1 aldehyde dehydrogenase family protein [Arthrobacter sulfonylureivorans]